MKNITVSVPDDVYRAARVAAAEQGTSVSAIVAGHLRSLSSPPADDVEAFRRLRGEIRANNPGLSARDDLPRDQLHQRGLR